MAVDNKLMAIWIHTTSKAFQFYDREGVSPPNLRLEINAGFEGIFNWVNNGREGNEFVGPNRLQQSQPISKICVHTTRRNRLQFIRF